MVAVRSQTQFFEDTYVVVKIRSMRTGMEQDTQYEDTYIVVSCMSTHTHIVVVRDSAIRSV